MKHKRNLLFIAFLFLLLNKSWGLGRDSTKLYIPKGKPFFDRRFYIALTTELGVTPYHTTPSSSTVQFPYLIQDVNNNPISADTFKGSVNLKKHSRALSIGIITLEIGKPKGWFGEFGVAIMGTKGSNSFCDLGMGYNWSLATTDNILIRTAADLNYTESDMRMGSINNTNQNIQIFDKGYSYIHNSHSYNSSTTYSPRIYIQSRNKAEGAKLKLGIWLFPKRKIVTRINFGYTFQFYNKFKIAVNQDNGDGPTNYIVNSPGLNFTSTISNPDKLYNYNGFFANIEIGIRF